MAYASLPDLERRWRRLDEDEVVRAETLLGDATAMLDALMGLEEELEEPPATLRIVCCSMVIRAMMASEEEAYGVSQMDYVMGPFTQRAHYSNPNGDLFLTSQERAMLGIGSGAYITDFRPVVGGADA